MLDEQDQGTRIGVGVALGVVLLLIFGLLGWLTMRGGKPPAVKPAVVAAAAPAAAAPGVAAGDVFVDAPLAGTIAGTLYFAVGKAELPADAPAALAAIKQAAGSGKKLLISGFHDATGDPAMNAELAKNRAKAVRTALQADGIAPERAVLRKPESTTGDGNNQEARRVEVRIAE